MEITPGRPLTWREVIRSLGEAAVSLYLLGELLGWDWQPRWYLLSVAWSGIVFGFVGTALTIVGMYYERKAARVRVR